MSSRPHHPVLTSSLFGVAIVSGLVVGFIVMLNLHITVGLEEGYAASPAEVWAFSPLLSTVDVALLVGGPVLGFLAARRLLRNHP